MNGPIVVKIGGSLMDAVDPLIGLFKKRHLAVLIVPGGGRFARQVRETGISGDAAHWMAIAAMEQMGWFIASRGVNPVTSLKVPRRVEVLLPYTLLRNTDPLPHSWDVTSDTISAWIASSLSLPLILLKSIDGIRSGGIHQNLIAEEVPTEDVDPCFLRYVIAHRVNTIVVNGRKPRRLGNLLAGRKVLCTTIGF